MAANASTRVNYRWKYLFWAFFLALGGSLMAQNLTAKDYFLMGTAKYRCRACNQAVEDFDKALAMDKNYAEAYYGRSLAYACMKNYPSALIDIDHAIKLQPEQVLYREGRGRIQLASGKNKEALAEFGTALKMDSLCWQAWYGLAQVHDKLDSTAASRRAYQRAMALNPDYAMSYVGIAEMRIKEGDYEAALENLSTAGKIAPEYARIPELSSYAHLKKGNHAKAIEEATKATLLEPANKHAYFYRAEAYLALQDYAKADADYALTLDVDKRDSQSWYKRGLCSEKLGDLITAKKYYSKALQRHAQIKEAYRNRSAIWEKFEKPKKALADLSEAIRLDPTDVPMRLHRGFIHLDLQMIQLASDDFVAATNQDPQSGEGFYGLGLARYQNGNSLDACEAWKQALKLDEPRAATELSKYCND